MTTQQSPPNQSAPMDDKGVPKSLQVEEEKRYVEEEENISMELDRSMPSMSLGSSSNDLPELFVKTISEFKRKPSVPNLHDVAQRKYTIFCHNRTAELYSTFLALIGDIPDFSEASFVPEFNACVPRGGARNLRPVCGMAKGSSIAHGIVRYEYHNSIIEECHKDGVEHGLRVVIFQTGDIWIRLFSNGSRLAQIVLTSDYRVSPSPPPVDGGGLKMLRSHLHLIIDWSKAK